MERDEFILTNSQTLAPLSDSHSVFLVQRTDNKKLYVKKELSIFNSELYDNLRDHPIRNMPQICAVIEVDDRLIVFEEYISGDTLEEMLASQGTLNEVDTIRIIKQLCSIVRCLHESVPSIVHRDIKPSNIIVTPDGTVKLLDMNAAKWVRDGATKDTCLIGTVGYAAPEQYGFCASSVQTDIYAIGVLMNVMLTGAFPNEQVASNPLGAIIKRCTQMDPDQRYASIPELVDAIDAAVPIDKPKRSNHRRLPGFRTHNSAKMIFAAFGYGIIIALGLTLSVETNNKLDLWLNRFAFIGLLLAEVLFWGNYCDIQRKIGLSNVSNRGLRLFLKAICSIAFFLLGVFVLVIIESLFF